MRVLHFYKTALPDSMGGVEQMIDQLARGAAAHGVEVDVLALGRRKLGEVIRFNGYNSHRARSDFEIASTTFSVSVFAAFARLASKADLIHYHYPWPFMGLVHFSKRRRKPTLVTYHSDIVRQRRLAKLYRPLQHRFLGDVDKIVITSPNYLQTSEVLPRFRDKVSVIPIGVDQHSYPVPSSERLEHWQKRFGTRFFLFVGVLRYYKGLHILLDALPGLDVPVVIVGAGPVEQELREQSRRLGLRNVHFLGFVPEEDKVALQMLCYAVLFPSYLRSEAFGVSLLEGAMFGKPMISCEIGTGTSFVNIAHETGLVVPPGDPAAFRGAMEYLWNNPAHASALGAKAKQRFETLFTAEQMTQQYVQLYGRMCDKGYR